MMFMRNYSNNAKNLVNAIWRKDHDETRRLMLSLNPIANFCMDISSYTGNGNDTHDLNVFQLAFDLNYEDMIEKLAPQQKAEDLKEYLSISISRQNPTLFNCILKYVDDDETLDNALEMAFMTVQILAPHGISTPWDRRITNQVNNFCNHTVRSLLLRKKLPKDFIDEMFSNMDDLGSQGKLTTEQMDRIAEMCQRETLNNIVKKIAEPEQKKRII